MPTTLQARLPATSTSLYRLFLRTCSASVLHHKAATRNLRRLWRPTFDAAAEITLQLQSGSDSATARKHQEGWLEIWEQRIDTTLSLLYTSCNSRGLPHRLTRNLGYLVLSEDQRMHEHHHKIWVPHRPRTSPLYKPPQTSSQGDIAKAEKLRRWERFDAYAWTSLSQVIKLAEGRHGISLGRITGKTRVRGRAN